MSRGDKAPASERSWLPDLNRLVAEARAEDLPALAGRLHEAQLAAEMRVRQVERVVAPLAATAERWLTPAEAAAIAAVQVKRIYDWAQAKKWASRPSRRCLRINEAAFRAWLAGRVVS